MENVCEIIYKIGAENKIYGTEKGICRITGKESMGISFNKWELLNFVTHIGKDTNIGYGQVQKWEIEEWHSDWSERNDQNKLMRNVPLYNQEGKGFLYGIRPSYWLPKHQFICKMP